MINNSMRDSNNLIGDEKGNVNCYDRFGNFIGYITLKTARKFIDQCYSYLLTTQDIVDY